MEQDAILQHTSEHCLVGIKGSVKRSEDGYFVHSNCDVDVIVSEEPPLGSTCSVCPAPLQQPRAVTMLTLRWVTRISRLLREPGVAKPAEMYNIIENLCLGRRRLELFGEVRLRAPPLVCPSLR